MSIETHLYWFDSKRIKPFKVLSLQAIPSSGDVMLLKDKKGETQSLEVKKVYHDMSKDGLQSAHLYVIDEKAKAFVYDELGRVNEDVLGVISEEFVPEPGKVV